MTSISSAYSETRHSDEPILTVYHLCEDDFLSRLVSNAVLNYNGDKQSPRVTPRRRLNNVDVILFVMSEDFGVRYVGWTIQLNQRLSEHQVSALQL